MSVTSVRLRSKAAATIIGVLALFGLSFALSAGASAEPSSSPYPPSNACAVSVSDQSVQAGQTVNVQGSGFPANTSVSLSVHSATTSLGSVTTGSDGSFATTVTMPASLVGSHELVASSASTTCSFSFGTDPADQHRPPAANNPPHNGTTASTGFEAISASVIALTLLAGGAALLLIGRRRNRA